jgi:hypothetical protein
LNLGVTEEYSTSSGSRKSPIPKLDDEWRPQKTSFNDHSKKDGILWTHLPNGGRQNGEENGISFTERENRKGRSRREWLGDIVDRGNANMITLSREAKNREIWRRRVRQAFDTYGQCAHRDWEREREKERERLAYSLATLPNYVDSNP